MRRLRKKRAKLHTDVQRAENEQQYHESVHGKQKNGPFFEDLELEIDDEQVGENPDEFEQTAAEEIQDVGESGDEEDRVDESRNRQKSRQERVSLHSRHQDDEKHSSDQQKYVNEVLYFYRKELRDAKNRRNQEGPTGWRAFHHKQRSTLLQSLQKDQHEILVRAARARGRILV